MREARAANAVAATQSALTTVDTERRGLDALRHALAGPLGAAFDEAVGRIGAAKGRVIVTGMGKSGHVGRKLAATLASTGTPAHFVHAAEASHGDLGMILKDDVILALSWSGESAELADIVRHARRFGVLLVAITANPASALGREADICLALPKAQEACPNGLAPTTSTTMQMVLGDAIAVALLDRRGFSATDFRVFHPGGKLGAQLKLVRDVMHRGERLPLVETGTRIGPTLEIMTAKGFGCVVVTGPGGMLAGIITDGDLRRAMGPDLVDRPVDALMTRTPKVVAPDDLLAEALKFAEHHRIGVLVVVEGGRPVGLVHLLDLLREGVA